MHNQDNYMYNYVHSLAPMPLAHSPSFSMLHAGKVGGGLIRDSTYETPQVSKCGWDSDVQTTELHSK